MTLTYDETGGRRPSGGQFLRQADRFDAPPARPGVRRQLAGVGQVVTALILRETKTRFGQSKFGYVWALLEPAAFVTMFVVIRTAISTATPFGESVVLFMMTGLIIMRLFTSITSGVMAAISANKALLAYPPVKPTDVILARFVLEALTMLIVTSLFFAILSLTVDFRVVVDHAAFAAGIAATLLLAAGFGVFNAVVSTMIPTYGRVWGIIRLPLFILSGIFYVPRSLPDSAQDVLWWNPVLHCVEWVRTGTYLTYDPLLDRWYVLAMGLGFLGAGLALERIYRFRLLSS